MRYSFPYKYYIIEEGIKHTRMREVGIYIYILGALDSL
jgi:hypothetical protein